MKRLLLTFLTLFAFYAVIFAAPISEETAREKAVRFMLSKKQEGTSSARNAQRFGGSSYWATLTAVESQEAYYVFNIDSVNGYVIVSGDDRMPDVLGYAYHGTYKPEEIPDNMRAWLQGYVEEYQYLQSHSDAKGASLTSVTGDAIQPLLECTWNQRAPYNDLCPKINGKYTITGCVATAMAQVMFYHKWPKQTTKAIPAYTTNSAGIYMPQIEITAIDWDNIIPTYGNSGGTIAQNQAVAELMLLCGCAVRMDYGLNASSAYCSPNALTEYFGYDKLSILEVLRNSFSSDIWNQMIYNEMKEGRPVLYSGQGSGGGHQFVIDGYDRNDYFHVNWGWGGSQDNYFLLSSLKEYNSDQRAIIGIESQASVDRKYAYAELVGETLTFYYDNKRETRKGTMFNVNNKEWTGDDYRNLITAVKFDSSFGSYNYLVSTNSMFYYMENLTSIQGLEYLNTQNVTDMGWMFGECQNLTSLDISSFNTQKVTNMYGMFYNCKKITSLDLSNFDTQNVTNMSWMFGGCQNLSILDISLFYTQNVTNMYGMFYNCSNFTSLDLSNFDTQNVTDMSYMFGNCNNFTALDISYFNTENVTNMNSMFSGCGSLKSLDLTNFNTENVTDMSWMFNYCSSLQDIYTGENWNTQNVTSGNNMFDGCYNLIGEKGTQYEYNKSDYTYAHIDGGNDNPGYFSTKGSSYPYPYAVISNDNKTLTFYYGNGRDIPGSMRIKAYRYYDNRDWDSVAQSLETVVFDKSFADCNDITSTSYWFYNCKNLTSIQGLKYLNTQNVTNMYGMFYNCSSITSLDMGHFNTDNVTDMGWMFYDCSNLNSLDVSKFDTRKVTNMYCMLYNCQKITSLDLSNFNTQNVTNMSWMFGYCQNLTSLDLTNIDTHNVTDMSWMFGECQNLTSLDLSKFNTQSVTDMGGMFYNCSNLTSLDLTNFNTHNVTIMNRMFSGCGNLTSLDLGNFNTQNVTNMNCIFYGCSSLNSLDLSNFNTQNVTDMGFMFYYCKNLTSLDLSKFNTQNVTNMSGIFSGCYSLQTIYAGEGWNTENVENSNYMFNGCTNLVGQDGTKYNYNYQDKTKAHYGTGGYLTYKVPVLRGDVNDDGKVNMDDVTLVTNIILGTEVATEAADVNNDGKVSMQDVMFIINYIKNGKFPDEGSMSPQQSLFVGDNQVYVAGQEYHATILYQVLKNDDNTIDVIVPEYELKETVMGDITIGKYTIKNIPYDVTKGSYYKEYADGILSMHFKSSTLDKDYLFNNNTITTSIEVKTDGTNANVANNYSIGSMPFPIETTFTGKLQSDQQ